MVSINLKTIYQDTTRDSKNLLTERLCNERGADKAMDEGVENGGLVLMGRERGSMGGSVDGRIFR